QSKIVRFYAFVQTKDGDLGELLIRNGLARNHGFRAAPPGLKNSRVEFEKLQQFESQARHEKIGVWGVNAGRSDEHPKTPPSSIPNPGPSSALSTPAQQSKSHAKDQNPLGRIDVNTATEKELTTVPGTGHVMAGRIIEQRIAAGTNFFIVISGFGIDAGDYC